MRSVFGIAVIEVDGFVITMIPREGERIERKPLRPIEVRKTAPKTRACGGHRGQIAA